jgi:hypothetical protein
VAQLNTKKLEEATAQLTTKRAKRAFDLAIDRSDQEKLLQFVAVFHLMQHGRAMLEYEAMQVMHAHGMDAWLANLDVCYAFQDLFEFLEVEHSGMHWSDNSGWDIVVSLAHVLKEELKAKIAAANFFALSADESTAIDHKSYLSVTVCTYCWHAASF